MLSKPRLYLSLALLTLCAAPNAYAQVTALLFEREDIRITSPSYVEPAKPDPTKDAPAKPPAPSTGHAPLTFNVEVRSQDALRLEYIHTLNSMTDTTGVMIVFASPSTIGLPALKVPTPVDTLFVLENGTIAQILPNTVLADLTQEIAAKSPIKAFLFLKAGTVAARNIHPQDVITSSQFTPSPPLMN